MGGGGVMILDTMLEYLKLNKMTVLTSSTRRPDLNIIENVWHLMEEILYSDRQCNEQKKLIHALERCAKEFNKETIINIST